MCGKPKAVQTIQQDPEGDAQRAAEKAVAETNVKKAMRRGSAGSLLSMPSGESSGSSGSSSWVANGIKQKAAGITNKVIKKSQLGGGL